MDREIESLLQRVRDAKRTPFWQQTPQAARSTPTLMKLLFGEAPAVARTEDLTFPSGNGETVRARLYVPAATADSVIVFFHGGGWVVGSVDDYHPFTATLAARTNCAVLSVDYGLAPEHPFPGPVQDATAALEFAAAHAAAWLGRDVRSLIAMGDSAGATLATVASRLHNQGAARPVDLQVLFYPVADARFDTPSYTQYGEGFLLTRRDMEWFWQQYCPDTERRLHGNASPVHATDLSTSPPAIVFPAGLDPLCSEGEAYAARLSDAGVDCETVRCEGLPHAFLAMINYAPSAARAFDWAVERIRAAPARNER